MLATACRSRRFHWGLPFTILKCSQVAVVSTIEADPALALVHQAGDRQLTDPRLEVSGSLWHGPSMRPEPRVDRVVELLRGANVDIGVMVVVAAGGTGTSAVRDSHDLSIRSSIAERRRSRSSG